MPKRRERYFCVTSASCCCCRRRRQLLMPRPALCNTTLRRQVYRTVRALQRHEQTGRCTPVNWREGEPDLVRRGCGCGLGRRASQRFARGGQYRHCT